MKPDQRSTNIPDDTSKVPFVLLVKGFLTTDAHLGDKVTITTVVGRNITGELTAVNPSYDHSFGASPPELMNIGSELRRILLDGK